MSHPFHFPFISTMFLFAIDRNARGFYIAKKRNKCGGISVKIIKIAIQCWISAFPPAPVLCKARFTFLHLTVNTESENVDTGCYLFQFNNFCSTYLHIMTNCVFQIAQAILFHFQFHWIHFYREKWCQYVCNFLSTFLIFARILQILLLRRSCSKLQSMPDFCVVCWLLLIFFLSLSLFHFVCLPFSFSFSVSRLSRQIKTKRNCIYIH